MVVMNLVFLVHLMYLVSRFTVVGAGISPTLTTWYSWMDPLHLLHLLLLLQLLHLPQLNIEKLKSIKLQKIFNKVKLAPEKLEISSKTLKSLN